MSKSNDFATQVKHYRWQRGWTQEQMAVFLDVSLRTLTRIEGGETVSEGVQFRVGEKISPPKEKGHAA